MIVTVTLVSARAPEGVDVQVCLPRFLERQYGHFQTLRSFLEATGGGAILETLEAQAACDLPALLADPEPAEPLFYRIRKAVRVVRGSALVEDHVARLTATGQPPSRPVPWLRNLVVEIERQEIRDQVLDAFFDTLAANRGQHAGAIERLFFESGAFVRLSAEEVGRDIGLRLAGQRARDLLLVCEACKSFERDAPSMRTLHYRAARHFGSCKEFGSVNAVCENALALLGGAGEGAEKFYEQLWFSYLRSDRMDDAQEVLEAWVCLQPQRREPLVWRALVRAGGDPGRLVEELAVSGAAVGQSTRQGNVMHAQACALAGQPLKGEAALRMAYAEKGRADRVNTVEINYELMLSNLARPANRRRTMARAFAVMGIPCRVEGLAIEGLRFAPADPAEGAGTARPHGDLVSVVMTAFNSEAYIETAVRAILAQTHANLELLIVDDCSTDGTRLLCARLAEEDSRIRLLQTERNSGTYVAKNLALRQAEGTFLTLCDSDDAWLPGHLQAHLDYMADNPDKACSVSNWVRLSDSGLFDVGMRGSFVESCPHSTFFRRGVFREIGFFDSVRFGADREFWSRLEYTFGMGSIGRIDAVLTIGRRHDASLTSSGAGQLDPLNRSAPRFAYWRAWNRWHFETVVTGGKLYNSGFAGDRPYAVPAVMEPHPAP